MRATNLHITVNRSTRKATVLGNSDKIFIGDSTVGVTVDGFEEGENELAPCIEILNHGEVCAVAVLAPDENDATTFVGNLNTNTVQFANAFQGCVHNVVKQFDFRIFATTVDEPIAVGTVKISNFPLVGNSETPSNIVSAGEFSESVRERMDEFESRLSDTDEDFDSLTELVDTINRNVDGLTSLTSRQSEAINGVNDSVSRIENDIDLLKEEVPRNSDEINSIKSAITEANKKIKMNENSIATANTTAANAMITASEKQDKLTNAQLEAIEDVKNKQIKLVQSPSNFIQITDSINYEKQVTLQILGGTSTRPTVDMHSRPPQFTNIDGNLALNPDVVAHVADVEEKYATKRALASQTARKQDKLTNAQLEAIQCVIDNDYKGDKGDKGDKGEPGADGASAYEVARANGYAGTEGEWLASLKGADGKDGTPQDVQAALAEMDEVTIGSDATTNEKAVAVGYHAKGGEFSVAIGNYAEVSTGAGNNDSSGSEGYSIAIGGYSKTEACNAIAIGERSKTKSSGSVAIGYYAEVSTDASDAVQLGQGINATANSLQFRSYQLVGADGIIPAERLPEIPAERLPEIPAAKLTGTIDAERLPTIPAAKLTGTIDVERLPTIPAEKLTDVVGAGASLGFGLKEEVLWCRWNTQTLGKVFTPSIPSQFSQIPVYIFPQDDNEFIVEGYYIENGAHGSYDGCYELTNDKSELLENIDIPVIESKRIIVDAAVIPSISNHGVEIADVQMLTNVHSPSEAPIFWNNHRLAYIKPANNATEFVIAEPTGVNAEENEMMTYEVLLDLTDVNNEPEIIVPTNVIWLGEEPAFTQGKKYLLAFRRVCGQLLASLQGEW